MSLLIHRSMSTILRIDFSHLPPEIQADILLHGKNLVEDERHMCIFDTFLCVYWEVAVGRRSLGCGGHFLLSCLFT